MTERRERIERAIDGYFDTKTHVMVEQVLAIARPGELADDEAMETLFDEFVAVLRQRYDRDDPGWREAAEGFLKREFDRQVEQARRRDDELLDLLDEEGPATDT